MATPGGKAISNHTQGSQPTRALLALAVEPVLRKLIRLLIRRGVPCRSLVDLVRWSYVDVAMSECAIPGRRPTRSRAALITGLTRKEVQRLALRRQPNGHQPLKSDRVLAAWTRMASGGKGLIPLEGGARSFRTLCETYAKDVPYRVVFEELLHRGVLEPVTGAKSVKLVRGSAPIAVEPGRLEHFGQAAGGLIGTLAHNLSLNGSARRYRPEGMVADEIPKEHLAALREQLEPEGLALRKKGESLLARFQSSARGSTSRVGLGYYFFED